MAWDPLHWIIAFRCRRDGCGLLFWIGHFAIIWFLLLNPLIQSPYLVNAFQFKSSRFHNTMHHNHSIKGRNPWKIQFETLLLLCNNISSSIQSRLHLSLLGLTFDNWMLQSKTISADLNIWRLPSFRLDSKLLKKSRCTETQGPVKSMQFGGLSHFFAFEETLMGVLPLWSRV